MLSSHRMIACKETKEEHRKSSNHHARAGGARGAHSHSMKHSTITHHHFRQFIVLVQINSNSYFCSLLLFVHYPISPSLLLLYDVSFLLFVTLQRDFTQKLFLYIIEVKVVFLLNLLDTKCILVSIVCGRIKMSVHESFRM